MSTNPNNRAEDRRIRVESAIRAGLPVNPPITAEQQNAARLEAIEFFHSPLNYQENQRIRRETEAQITERRRQAEEEEREAQREAQREDAMNDSMEMEIESGGKTRKTRTRGYKRKMRKGRKVRKTKKVRKTNKVRKTKKARKQKK
uniref:Uncharacterized protein n=1 Tax=viral metagenome TaxID=1070528 RepID=A0A6C0B0L6_9ZZZZ